MKRDLSQEIGTAKKLTTLLDTKFKLWKFSFGIDPILNIVPWLGSAVGAITSLYLFWLAYKMNSSAQVYFRMLWNIFLDFWLGSIPVLGIVFDAFYKSNVRNLKIIEDFYKRG
jgi:hypothetical protein